ncbi:hypothetical protein SDRG_05940 [Saprolegnia diclina VS20]|uniref:Uncharacterized protein n=1 Tax=Saprolegnia diclina (strain VS20) TaxID=1156394 RepID=T0QP51_SAPDV|nr:hypothetical protein SDRG_05940 [Saprolegnia diclina VS20]EQC36486.1 hypothetical protein SDRG_05940 [Saprolegnia diclina VS20]|eukprot:XP_008609907.1 hypothetical protein SDRG_05940 [Saprolegnia diclina VS20]
MNILDVIRGGATDAHVRGGSPKLGPVMRSLSWRDKYINQAEFAVPLNGARTLRIKQLPNGETTGLGTGLTVWPAAVVLLQYLVHRYGHLGCKRVVELGCGTGAVGLAAAMLGGRVVLTDQAQVQFLMRENAALNNVSVELCEYDWGKPLVGPLATPVDLVLISDCILPKLYPIEPLVSAIDLLCGPWTRVLISFEYRYFPAFDPKARFCALLDTVGLELRTIPLTEQHPSYHVEDIELWEIARMRSRRRPILETRDA